MNQSFQQTNERGPGGTGRAQAEQRLIDDAVAGAIGALRFHVVGAGAGPDRIERAGVAETGGPGKFIIGFKTAPGETPDRLVESAYRELLASRQDLAVASPGGDTSYVVTAERGVAAINRQDLAETVVRLATERYSDRYFSTSLTRTMELPVPKPEIDRTLTEIRLIGSLALFDRYLEGSREEFGFVAKRCPAGTLITTRGSSKSAASEDDLCLVTGADPEALSLAVTTRGKKASLNAPLAHLIFAARPEIQYIVHAHIPVAEAASTGRDTSPATLEDWKFIEPLVKSGAAAVHQPHHGVLILLKDLSDLFNILERNNVYRTNSDHYDDAYRRFLGKTDLIERFAGRVPAHAPVLDLAAGTGEVSALLAARGFNALTLCDISKPMLDVAARKLRGIVDPDRIIQCAIESMPFHCRFDGVICRQAINYLPPERLTAGLMRIREALRERGELYFNTFDPSAVRDGVTGMARIEHEGRILHTREGNVTLGDRIIHGQRTEIFDTTGGYRLLYDLNSFWGYSRETLESAARAAGFTEVDSDKRGNSLYFRCRR